MNISTNPGPNRLKRPFAVAVALSILGATLVVGQQVASSPAVAAPGPLRCDTTPGPAYALPGGVMEVAETLNVGETWAGHYVSQALLTDADQQYVAYYNANREMTVAHRTLPSTTWDYTVLPQSVVWDSHNSITMDVDRDGHLHLAGNMHGVPLVYFRTAIAHDASTLTRVTTMVNTALESAVTYPSFRTAPDGSMLFRYRSGGSGDGEDIYNKYDEATKTWSAFLSTPLIDGEGLRNAYADDRGPILGPDGYYHTAWVWRDTGAAESNSMPSYARSADMINWETSQGVAIPLPITYTTGDVIEEIGPGNGFINNNIRVGFDTDGGALVTYHRYDEEGDSQIYLARPSDEGWEIKQITDWEGRWSFSGGGTIAFEVNVLAAEGLPNGDIKVDVTCKGDARSIIVDAETLDQITEITTPPLPFAVTDVQSDFPGMLVNTNRDLRSDPASRLLRWESLPSNRDAPRPQPWPSAGQISVVTLAPSDASVRIDALPDNTEYEAGEIATVQADVRNISDSTVTSRLDLTVPAGWPDSMPSGLITLEPGEVQRVPLTVTVPLVSRYETVTLGLGFGEGSTRAEARAQLTAHVGAPPVGFVDHVDLGSAVSESDHALVASATSGINSEAGLSRRYTRATANNFFEFTVEKPEGEAFTIQVRETYGANLLREYYLLVNGERVHTNTVAWTGGEGTPSYLITVDDPDLIVGSTAVVRFQMNEFGRNSDASVADVWITSAAGTDDETAPTTRAEFSASDTEWSRGPVTMSLFAQDDRAGAVTLEYRIGDGSFAPYISPVAITTDGVHEVAYRATDAAGNISTLGAKTVRIDSTAPETEAELTANRAVALSASDPVPADGESSEIAAIEWRLDGGSWQGYGGEIQFDALAHSLEYRSTDGAGNVSTIGSIDVPAVLAPLTQAQLESASRGGVSANGPLDPGEILELTLDNQDDGLEVTGWIYSVPTLLGADAVADGRVAFELSAAVSSGAHLVAVYDAFGVLVGWDNLTILPAAVGSPDLANTGVNAAGIGLVALVLMMAGLGTVWGRRLRTSGD